MARMTPSEALVETRPHASKRPQTWQAPGCLFAARMYHRRLSGCQSYFDTDNIDSTQQRDVQEGRLRASQWVQSVLAIFDSTGPKPHYLPSLRHVLHRSAAADWILLLPDVHTTSCILYSSSGIAVPLNALGSQISEPSK